MFNRSTTLPYCTCGTAFSQQKSAMSTGALRQFISDRVDQLEYDDPSVKRVLTLITNKVTAKGDHVHQALQRVFDTFGNWK